MGASSKWEKVSSFAKQLHDCNIMLTGQSSSKDKTEAWVGSRTFDKFYESVNTTVRDERSLLRLALTCISSTVEINPPDTSSSYSQLKNTVLAKEYKFDNVFDATATQVGVPSWFHCPDIIFYDQETIFSDLGIPKMIEAALGGYHATVFAYGQVYILIFLGHEGLTHERLVRGRHTRWKDMNTASIMLPMTKGALE